MPTRRWRCCGPGSLPSRRPAVCLVVAQQHVGVEAAVVAGVARRADLVDLQQHGVAVAVQPHRVDVLGMSRRRTLDPLLPPRARVIRRLPCLQRAGQRVVVHPRHHEHFSGAALLGDRRDQPAGVALEPRRDRGVQRHRTTIPSAAIAALTSLILSSRKWNTLAASTASAPATTAGAKCSTVPAPPLAMTGTVTAARTALSIGRSKPALVPSKSIEFSRISPTPSSAPRAAHPTASMPVPRRPPCVVTSQPDGVGTDSAGTVRASTDNTTH